MAPKNTVIIDGERLKNELNKIDKYNSEIARECGYNPSYFSTCAYYNTMARPCMKMLTLLYGISYDDIKPIKSETEESKEKDELLEQKIQDLTADRLYALIYTAVYDAVKEVKGGD